VVSQFGVHDLTGNLTRLAREPLPDRRFPRYVVARVSLTATPSREPLEAPCRIVD
jgi:hypothetical protein